ncbi:MAG: carboxypeptidase regulatory-like domain-containing protein [Acidobacteriaceae bacterium]|nr:carboxypeptidase regulatory-like domain-containing protein [Acidobacteriaceae bacterium]
MRLACTSLCMMFIAASGFAQGDRGTITGTIGDPAGAVVAGAAVETRNVETGATYQAATTTTGNYTLAELPAGSYELSVSVPGFKKYVRQGLTVQVGQTLRIDVMLEVGTATESVTVNEAAPLLKTESGELSHNVGGERLDDLPVLGIGSTQAGSAGIRNPYAVTEIIPGTYWVPNSIVRVNGAPSNTEAMRIEGLDASNSFTPGVPAQSQPSVDSIEEFGIQTSNFAAEYGQVGGGLFNVTMKSGTNQFHGTAYDYFVNEVLNAGTPFTTNGNGSLIRPVQRRNDWGFTLGGPMWIPKIYNGHDRTFFFFNFEQFRETQNINNTPITVPTALYRTGNFSQALTGRTLGTDPLGRPIMENTIYDPSTQRVVNGAIVRDPFPGNTIPASQMDPVALKVQSLIPQPTSSGLINNYLPSYPSQRVTEIPALKADQFFSPRDKASFYWSRTSTASQYSPTLGASDGLPLPITSAIGTFTTSSLYRINYERTMTPTLLLHWGGGFQDIFFNDNAPVLNYNAQQQLGLTGATVARLFPSFQFPASQPQGGMKNMGPASNRNLWWSKPSSNLSITWVRNNHTYKAGAEMRIEAYPGYIYTSTNGVYQFAAAESGLPSTNGQNLNGGSVGFPYASFLLGAVDTVTISNPTSLRPVKSQWGGFAQDSWKITRKFTLDYGVRYDYSTYIKDDQGRWANFSPTAPNPSAGNLPGAVIFEGSGPGRCNCAFAHNYPWAFAPRLGAAYQIMPKTVLRVGAGIVYSGTPDSNGATSSTTSVNPITTPSFGQPVMTLQNGIPFTPSPWPNLNPGQFPFPGTLTPPKVAVDQNAGRPARQYQWSIGLQRELSRNVVVEAAYVGNRGVWWNAPGLIDVNALTPQRLASYGLDINNPADQKLLAAPLNSPTAVARGFSNPPYAGFPLGSTVAQSLRPFPQFTSITYLWAPNGKTWYDSLQLKATQRFSHGLSLTSSFTWQKEETLGAESNPNTGTTGNAAINDVFNRNQNKYLSQYSRPFAFNVAANYRVPAPNFNKALSWVVRDWTVGAFLQYASGLPIESPFAQNSLNTLLLRNVTSPAIGTFADRVPGVALFTHDLNCHCFDPNKTFVLNPAAWVQPPAGQFGTAAAYYNDYRYQRRPVENMSIGRVFRIKEKASFNLRMEFTNIFNRTEANNPTATNTLATQTSSPGGQTTAGFGYINNGTTFSPPRQGVIVGRFQF